MSFRRLIAGQLAAAVVASALVGVATTTPASARPSALAEATVAAASTPTIAFAGNARCDVTAGEWVVRWTIKAWSTGATIQSARDDLNSHSYPLVNNPLPVGLDDWPVFSGLRLPGTATDAGLTLTFANPPTAAPLTRRIQLTGGCEQQEAPACVPAADVRYKHTFEPTTGTASVEILGAPACRYPDAPPSILYRTQVDQPDGSVQTFAFMQAQIGAGIYNKSSMLVDAPPCAHRRYLQFHTPPFAADPNLIFGAAQAPGNQSTGPLATDAAESPACVAPTTRFASTRIRTGPRSWVPAIRITVTNAADAALPAAFAVLYTTASNEPRREVHQAAPGETVIVTIAAPAGTADFRADVHFPLAYGQPPGGSYTWQQPPPPPRRTVRPYPGKWLPRRA